MNEPEIRQLLHEAAESGEPQQPVSGSVIHLRARQKRKQQLSAVAAAAGVLCVLAGVALFSVDRTRSSSVPASDSSGSTATYRAVSILLPEGWQQQSVGSDFDPCTAQSNTVYLGSSLQGELHQQRHCKQQVSEPWLWISDYAEPVTPGPAKTVVIPSGGLGWLRSSPELPSPVPSGFIQPIVQFPGDLLYLPWQKQAVFVSSTKASVRKSLLERVRVTRPPRQGLVLPPEAEITGGAADLRKARLIAASPDRIRTAVALLQSLPTVDPSDACAWNEDDPLTLTVLTAIGKVTVVVSSDSTCLQAVSSEGGRVVVEKGTAKRIYDLVGADR